MGTNYTGLYNQQNIPRKFYKIILRILHLTLTQHVNCGTKIVMYIFLFIAIKAAVDTIPKLNSTQLLQVPTEAEDGCIRCAVVGTSGVLNGSRLGTEIDSNHYVFRSDSHISGRILQKEYFDYIYS